MVNHLDSEWLACFAGDDDHKDFLGNSARSDKQMVEPQFMFLPFLIIKGH